MATALLALERYEEAAVAFDCAFGICPSDVKLQQQAVEMRQLAKKQQLSTPAPQITPTSVTQSVFSGNIMERTEKISTPAILPVRTSRFAGNNPNGDVVTLEPMGEAVRC